MSKIAKNWFAFFQRESVLCIAVLLAIVSFIFVPPSLHFMESIDWDTLALLFSLMAVMKGFQKAGFFVFLGNQLLKRTATSRIMLFILVFLPFVFSMFITNDVALITFVPFSLIVLHMAKQERLLVPLTVMQTLAANLGSMLTPMGNPQNLYLYTKSAMSFGDLCLLMLPYVLISAAGLIVFILLKKSTPISKIAVTVKLGSPAALLCCFCGFAICILGIFKILSPLILAAIILVFLLLTDIKLFAVIDYSLLGTFLAFFIFIGNVKEIEWFRSALSSVLAGHVEMVAVLSSQIISNVPAALLLSGFTDDWHALIIGCNLGGLGTLIASMASLISYKIIAKEYPDQRRKYLATFTLSNIVFLAVLCLVRLLIGIWFPS